VLYWRHGPADRRASAERLAFLLGVGRICWSLQQVPIGFRVHWRGTVPLSDHEQRLLEQMEQALLAEDPKFATAMRGADLRRRYRRRAVLAGLVFLVGVVMLMTGAVTQVIALGVAGFVVMLASAFYAVTSWRRVPPTDGTAAADVPDISPGSPRRQGRQRRPKGARTSGSFMERMEQRWRNRRERGYGQ
jgi:hypothetical protein